MEHGLIGKLPRSAQSDLPLQGRVSSRYDTETFSVTFGRYAPDTRIPRHRHARASLCIALSGGYDEQLDGSSRTILPGTLVSHPEGEAHANRHAPSPTDLLTIELSETALDFSRGVSPQLDESWHRPAAFLLPDAYRIIHEIETSPPADGLVIEDLVWRMIARSTGDQEISADLPIWLLAVRDYLDAYFADGPTLAMLAQLAGVHPVHLTRSFRRSFGCSIGDFVRRKQVEMALTLMAGGELGLDEISAATGFADQSHMTRRVRALTGRPPGRWRRRLRAI